MSMKKVFFGFLILVAVVMLVAGCTSPAPQAPPTTTPASTPVKTSPITTAPTANATAAPELSFAEEIAIIQKRTDENGPINMTLNSTTTVGLKENPTTGYLWNATVTAGLEIVNDTYSPPETQLSGAGGMHEWVVKAIGLGNQSFTSVYYRPWEAENSSDVRFTQRFVVAP